MSDDIKLLEMDIKLYEEIIQFMHDATEEIVILRKRIKELEVLLQKQTTKELPKRLGETLLS